MSAATLLRSVARRIARVPPPHSRPLVARGLHGSRPGGSLPPPTRNEIQDGRGYGLAAGMAAAGLPSFASKMARAPPSLRRLLHDSTSPKQSSIPPGAMFAYFAVFVGAYLLYFCVEPELQELGRNRDGLRIETEILFKELERCQRNCTYMLAGPSLAQCLQASGQGKESSGKQSS